MSNLIELFIVRWAALDDFAELRVKFKGSSQNHEQLW